MTLTFNPTTIQTRFIQRELMRLAAKGETVTAAEYLVTRLDKVLNVDIQRARVERETRNADTVNVAISSLSSDPVVANVALEPLGLVMDEDGVITAMP